MPGVRIRGEAKLLYNGRVPLCFDVLIETMRAGPL